MFCFGFIITGLPWLLNSIEIYRSPLPFRDIDSLANAIDSNPFVFPCNFHVVFVNLDHSSEIKPKVENLGFLISSYMSRYADHSSVCGTCDGNYTVSVSLDTGDECVEFEDGDDKRRLWKCGVLSELKFERNVESDDVFDEYLYATLGRSRVYSAVVVNTGEGDKFRAVVGKYRHGWIIGRVAEMDLVAEMVAEMFVKVFVSGAKDEGSIQGEFMPVGADGKIVLSFNLLNADPRDWIYDWYGNLLFLYSFIRLMCIIFMIFFQNIAKVQS